MNHLLKQSEVLSRLSQGNKLIGIISHVDELKEKIDKQIQITKNHEKGARLKSLFNKGFSPFFFPKQKNFNFFQKKC